MSTLPVLRELSDIDDSPSLFARGKLLYSLPTLTTVMKAFLNFFVFRFLLFCELNLLQSLQQIRLLFQTLSEVLASIHLHFEFLRVFELLGVGWFGCRTLIEDVRLLKVSWRERQMTKGTVVPETICRRVVHHWISVQRRERVVSREE